MDVEIIQTEEIAQKKKEATERQDLLEIDLKKMTQEFYCESCDKRYKTVSEMSNHLSSYDHHHRKVRFFSIHRNECEQFIYGLKLEEFN
jgi:Zinc-finger double-stranded RNA-binding